MPAFRPRSCRSGGLALALLPCLRAMTNPTCRERGFTLIESLVVLVIVLIAVLMSGPYLATQIQRSKLVGAANQGVGLMRLARMDAIKNRAAPWSSSRSARGRWRRFRTGDGNCRPSAGRAPERSDPAEPCRLLVPLRYGSGLGSPPHSRGRQSRALAVFRGDGSALDTGAFRIGAEELGGRAANFLEVIVSPAATARIQLRKWRGGTGGDCDDDANWHTNGEGGGAWKSS